MGQAGLDLCVDIFLDLGPVLWLIRRVLGNKRTKISGVDGRENSSLGDCVEVVENWKSVGQNVYLFDYSYKALTVINGRVSRITELVAIHAARQLNVCAAGKWGN
jgi:hypothetical protein